MKFYTLNTKNNLWSEKLNSFPNKKKDIFYQQKFADLCQKTIYKKKALVNEVVNQNFAIFKQKF